ncbi:MAG: VIT family protein [Pseudomonadota bacterium]|nr:VIT family protein [Pseudomonadota bacterium]
MRAGRDNKRRVMKENHKIKNIGWLRAAVLGANDGIVSTASLVIGVAASHASHSSVLITAVAALVAGSMSMATGEYVSVSSQSDTEAAALSEERAELKKDEAGERRELAAIYVKRGLDLALARQVADKLMDHDALSAHARDELGISEISTARPLQAAGASALSYAVGAALPLAVVAFMPPASLAVAVAVVALIALAVLGGLAAKTGGASVVPGVIRVTFWSALAMAVTYGVGTLFGTTVT